MSNTVPAISGMRNRLENEGPDCESRACPGCGSRASHLMFELPDVPVNCSALWRSSAEARACVRGDIELCACPQCNLVFNSRFNADLVEYNARYDNSLDFSTAFRKYAHGLAQRLVDSYGLHQKRIVEIGCGNGTFLKALCKVAGNTGVGYDPSFPGDSNPIPGVSFVNGYFGRRGAEQSFDFFCCRHVLEHIEKPLEFLKGLSKETAVKRGAVLYFEVPNGSAVLKGDGLWDVIYPHVSYFTEEALRRLFARAGFEVLRVGTSFSDQFLFIEARVSRSATNGRPEPAPDNLPELRDMIGSFTPRFEKAVEAWSRRLNQLVTARKPFGFWGAGAKGVTFLNLVPGARDMAHVIDSNPRKQQMFIPGTGQRICSPAALREIRPSSVILLNALYRDEIAAVLLSHGITADIITNPV